MSSSKVITIPGEAAHLKRKIRGHLASLGFTKDRAGRLVPPGMDKEHYREMHAHQRKSRILENKIWIDKHAPALLKYFATGSELDVKKIRPTIEIVRGDTWQSNLFRLATYYWRIPISQGYGRRIRFLVWDEYHDKLIGIFALGDAVFNLRARDAYIGWDHPRRSSALVNLMDAYALGAVPPYNMLLGGKLIASLIPTKEVVETFKEKYQDSVGIITGERKNPDLVAVTTTSALGRSSMFRLYEEEGEELPKSDAKRLSRSCLIHLFSVYAEFNASQKPAVEVRLILAALQIQLHGIANNIPVAPMQYREPAFRNMLDRLSNNAIELVFFLERHAPLLPGFDVFKLAFGAALDEIRQNYIKFQAVLFRWLPIDNPNYSPQGSVPQFLYCPTITSDAISEFQENMEPILKSLGRLECWASDLSIELQNHLLGDYADQRVEHRVPIDPDYLVVTVDSAHREKLMRYFNEETDYGQKARAAEAWARDEQLRRMEGPGE